jgi:hypothetical protein
MNFEAVWSQDVARNGADTNSIERLEEIALFNNPQLTKPALDDLDEGEINHIVEWLKGSFDNTSEGFQQV